MLLKPSGIAFMHSVKLSTLVATKNMIVIKRAATEPYTRPTEASEFEKASMKPAPSKNPPV